MSKIIGIDLGTTNSCVAIMEGSQPKVLENDFKFFGSFEKMLNKTKRSILIIENDENILGNLSQRFQKVGLLPLTAKDGYEGYVRACSEQPDFIISESLLPSMTGFRIARLLKFDERYKNIIIWKKYFMNVLFIKSIKERQVIKKRYLLKFR